MESAMHMQMFVKTPTGKTITLFVQQSYTIEKVKHMIYEKCGIQENKQRLSYEGRELEDHFTISDNNIDNNSTLYLDLKNLSSDTVNTVDNISEGILIHAKTITGEIINLKVKLSYTVADIKAQIQSKADIPSSQQKLYFNENHLEDGHTLDSYGMCQGSILFILILQGDWSQAKENGKEPHEQTKMDKIHGMDAYIAILFFEIYKTFLIAHSMMVT